MFLGVGELTADLKLSVVLIQTLSFSHEASVHKAPQRIKE